MAFLSFQPNKQFKPVQYTGNGSNNYQITSVGFKPGLIWGKNYGDATYNHWYADEVRGFGSGSTDTPILNVNNTDAEFNRNVFGDDGMLSNGFELNDYSDSNGNGKSNIAYCWKFSGTSGTSNTDGSITSTVSVNTDAKMSIVKWTGTGSAGATIGHGLGVKPAAAFIRRTNASSHLTVYNHVQGAQYKLYLDDTHALTDDTGFFNDVEPTTSVFTVGTEADTNASGGTHIGYFFAETKGFFRCGQYSGSNNSNGAFIHLGFKPAFIMFKNQGSSSERWAQYDKTRAGYNTQNNRLASNDNTAQGAETDKLSFYSMGFKITSNGDAHLNDSNSHQFFAWADEPMVSTNNIPATAR